MRSPTKSNLRWVDDSHPDSVEPLLTVRRAIKQPSFLRKLLMIPVIGAAWMLSYPVITLCEGFESLYAPKSISLKVQEQASKTALLVTKMRDLLFHFGVCRDNMACIFLPLSQRISHGVLSLFPLYNGNLPEFGVIRYAFVVIFVSFAVFLTMFLTQLKIISILAHCFQEQRLVTNW